MHNRIERLWRDERGMSYVYVGMGFMSFFVATTIAIDVGMFMTARSQSQNSADAGALAGATALVFDSWDNRSSGGPAVQSSINTARGNDVIHSDVSVTPSDVTFPVGPTSGVNDRVRVDVFRTSDRGNPVAALIGPIFGVPTANVWASATAEAAPANAVTCVKPFTIPDRWVENGSPAWDPSDTFDRYDGSPSVLLPNADEYFPIGHPRSNSYTLADKGMVLMIRAGTGSNIEPSFYFSWAMPGGSGGSWYRDNIAGCNATEVIRGMDIIQEPGNMVGPTNQGIDDLIAQDPLAYWDTAHDRVVSTMHPSPRVFPIPLFDPDFYQAGKVSGRPADLKVTGWLGFFVTHRVANNVYGRVTPITGIIKGGVGPSPNDTFPKVIRLVE